MARRAVFHWIRRPFLLSYSICLIIKHTRVLSGVARCRIWRIHVHNTRGNFCALMPALLLLTRRARTTSVYVLNTYYRPHWIDPRLKFFADPSMDHSLALRSNVTPLPRDWNRRSGRPRQTWLHTVESDVDPKNLRQVIRMMCVGGTFADLFI